MKKIFFPPSYLTIIITIAICLWVSSNINWGKNKWVDIIESDAKGYYAYLPAVFIYHDLNFGFFDYIEKEKYYNPNLFYDYRSGANGKMINKYYCGTALAILPFFFTAHFISPLLNYDADGYSKPYAVMVNCSALCYLLLGLFFLVKFLRLYEMKEWLLSFIVITAVFGTNLFYYSISEPGLSHIYSFSFITMFIYYSKRYFLLPGKKHLVILFALSGMIVLLRPINILIVFFVPFLAGSFNTLKSGFVYLLAKPKIAGFGIIIFTAICFIQLVIYKISTGSFIIYSYGSEKFNFLDPHIIDILFSYKKGLFLYTPVYLVSFAGLYYLWKSSKWEFSCWLGFFFLITYVFSSWWMWFYGGSFSSRVYVEYIGVFMISLAIWLQQIRIKYLRNIFIVFIVFLIGICQVQTYQYRYYLIHWADMTKEKYWDVFLRVDKLIK